MHTNYAETPGRVCPVGRWAGLGGEEGASQRSRARCATPGAEPGRGGPALRHGGEARQPSLGHRPEDWKDGASKGTKEAKVLGISPHKTGRAVIFTST